MKIICINNKTGDDEKSPLTLKKEYIVYGIGEIENSIWFCIEDDSYIFYPIWNSHIFFEVTDPRLSRFWIFTLDNICGITKPSLLFPEWANNQYFYWELVEGNCNDQNAKIFRKYKEKMDLEFPDSKITNMAEIIDDNWLFCPLCIDGWESSDNLDALVICPKCKNILNNPRYENKFPHI